LTVKG